jgi:hypothetical protein
LIALAGVCLMRWPGPECRARQLEHRLAEAHQLLDSEDFDFERLCSLVSDALSEGGEDPLTAGEAHFLLGSAYLRRWHGPQGNASTYLRQAREHLEEAARIGVPEEDRQRLAYRQGRLLYLLDGDPKEILKYLAPSVDEGADNKIEGYTMLAQTYRQPSVRDLKAALDANYRLLQLPILDESVLGPARLVRGELLLELHQTEEARQVLRAIGSHAPAATLERARCLRGMSFQQEGRWAEARDVWLDALKREPAQMQEPERILYYLGICQEKLDKATEAAQAWEECLQKNGTSDAGRAAALALADLRLHHGEDLRANNGPQDAVAAFGLAVNGLATPAQWRNSYVTLADARNAFESASLALRQSGQYELAMQLARHYEKLSAPGQAHRLLAEAATGGARAKLEEANQKTNVQSARQLDQEARVLLREAGDAYETAASRTPLAEEQADWLWLSAESYLEGQDQTRAALALGRFVEFTDTPRTPEQHLRCGEAWYRLAEIYRVQGNETAAETDYQECIKCISHYAYRARYELARVYMTKKELATARDHLEHNLKLLESDPDPEADEKTQYALGKVYLLLHKQNDPTYKLAIFRLEQALNKYPSSPLALPAREDMAEAYRLLAEEEWQNYRQSRDVQTQDFCRKTAREYTTKATEQYEKMAEMLSPPIRPQSSLSTEEKDSLRKAQYAAADGRYKLKQFDVAQRKYQQLAALYHHQFEGLYALHRQAQCHLARHEQAEADGVISTMLSDLRGMDTSTFPTPSGKTPWTPSQWEDWCAHPERDLKKMENGE